MREVLQREEYRDRHGEQKKTQRMTERSQARGTMTCVQGSRERVRGVHSSTMENMVALMVVDSTILADGRRVRSHSKQKPHVVRQPLLTFHLSVRKCASSAKKLEAVVQQLIPPKKRYRRAGGGVDVEAQSSIALLKRGRRAI